MRQIFRRIAAISIVLFIGLAFSGCSKLINEAVNSARAGSSDDEDNDDLEANAIKISKDTTYYNDYLGVSYK
jgi:hypothetical protein